jgi:circadian clock protein KaiC
MRKKPPRSASPADSLPKCPTGIHGLDDITDGGVPRGRPTLVCGRAGCGKTLLAAEFLVRGATKFGEPGVLMCFEETAEELEANVASLGFDLAGLVRRKKILVEHVRVERGEIQETGEYDLEGLFVRLNRAIESIGAKRVVLDTIEGLFAALPNEAILRAELRRLFRWLKDKGVTAIITAERGAQQLTRHGLEEYVSDCVILLDHRVHEQIATRYLRVVKYRGSLHGTNEYPFLIGDDGISVLPITARGLTHAVSSERISSGIPQLDAMLGGKGFFRGAGILLTGTPGTGKTSVAAAFAVAAARRDERALFFAFEEAPNQIIRNMNSIGMKLEPWLKREILKFHAARPTLYGLEMHLATMFKEIIAFKPKVVIVDPMTSLLAAGSETETKAMVTRLIDFLQSMQITSLFTSLAHEGSALQQSEIAISSLMDSCLLLQSIESAGERNRGLYVLKSRGMAHSNQIREFVISNQGIDLVDACIGSDGMLVASEQHARETAAVKAGKEKAKLARSVLDRKHTAVEVQIAALRSDYEAEELEARSANGGDGARTLTLADHRAVARLARMRHAEGDRAYTARENSRRRERER